VKQTYLELDHGQPENVNKKAVRLDSL